jgi:hypothetical protein
VADAPVGWALTLQLQSSAQSDSAAQKSETRFRVMDKHLRFGRSISIPIISISDFFYRHKCRFLPMNG